MKYLYLFICCILLNLSNLDAQWVLSHAGGGMNMVDAFAVIPNGVGSANLFVGISGSVSLSTDNGSSWNYVNSGLTGGDVRAFAVTSNGTSGTNLFAGTFLGMSLSTNNGASWTTVDTGLTKIDVQALAVSGTNRDCPITR